MILYRLPYSDEVITIESNEVIRLQSIDDLQGRKGFVMMPYDLESGHEILLSPLPTSPRGGEAYHCDKLEKISMHSSHRTLSEEVVTKDSSPWGGWEGAFSLFMSALQQGRFAKLVLSRMSEIEWEGNEDELKAAFYRACAMYPRMMIYLAFIPGEGAWMGCTPEILLSGTGNHYRTMALAGTMSVPDTVPVKEIVWSDKNRREQEIVADYIRESVSPYVNILEEEGPYTSRAGQLVHLKTEFHLAPKAGSTNIAHQLIKTLHPTPAVCGLPTKEAQKFIRENEGYDRSYYSGVVGMLDEDAETNLFVNLRCAHFNNGKLRLYAGGGILKDSEVQSEWNETNWKMKTILQTL